MDSYCAVVVKKLKDDQKEVVTIFSKDSTEAFFHDYTKFFSVDDDSITLKQDVQLEELKKTFRANIALDVFLAFASKEAVEVLRQAA